MKTTGFLCLAAVLNGCGSASQAQPVVFDLPEARTSGTLKVGCSSFPPNGTIPIQFTGYGQSLQPVIVWPEAPNGTKSVLVLIEDPDAPGPKPFVHWLCRNMSPATRQAPHGGTEGRNSNGTFGYYPPTPPPGPPHHYHFEVFALDRLLDHQAQDRDGAVQEMAGHVLAKGEIVGTVQG